MPVVLSCNTPSDDAADKDEHSGSEQGDSYTGKKDGEASYEEAMNKEETEIKPFSDKAENNV